MGLGYSQHSDDSWVSPKGAVGGGGTVSFVRKVRGGREGFHENISWKDVSSTSFNHKELLLLTRNSLSWNNGQE